MPAAKTVRHITADEMTEEEYRQWTQQLVADGMNPTAIRQDASPSVPAYGWDFELGATVESIDGKTFIVDLVDGRLTRTGSVPASRPERKKDANRSSSRNLKIA